MNRSSSTPLAAIYADADAALAEHVRAFDSSTRHTSPDVHTAALESMALSLMRALSGLSAHVDPVRRRALASELCAWAWAELTARFSAPGHVALIERVLAAFGPRRLDAATGGA